MTVQDLLDEVMRRDLDPVFTQVKICVDNWSSTADDVRTETSRTGTTTLIISGRSF